jgi:hypothetical protein
VERVEVGGGRPLCCRLIARGGGKVARRDGDEQQGDESREREMGN